MTRKPVSFTGQLIDICRIKIGAHRRSLSTSFKGLLWIWKRWSCWEDGLATQQLADAHVARGSGNGAAGVGAGATDGNILELAELVETPARILCILPIEVTLSLDEHGVFNVAAWKAEGLLQVPWREQP